MGSPKLVPLFFRHLSTGAGLTGLPITFDQYKKHDGTSVTPPTVVEVGGGAYYFIPAFLDPDAALFYRVNPGNANANPPGYDGVVRPEDFNADAIVAAAPYVSFIATGDTNSPIIVSVLSSQRNKVQVKFSEPVIMTTGANGALNVANYTISNLSVLSVAQVDDRTVLLTTSTQIPGATYNLTVLNVEDFYGNPIA